MNKINWRVRLKNPIFLVQIGLSILLPILAYMGLKLEDLTTWGAVANILAESVSNPYILGMVAVSAWNAINDPTTKGMADSQQMLDKIKPDVDKGE